MSRRPAVRATGGILSLLWTALLLWLAYLWVRSSFIGGWLVFANWSMAALPLAILSGLLLRRTLPDLRVPPLLLVVTGVLWVGAAWVAWSGIGPEWMLDGFVLRDPAVRWSGLLLRWFPPGLALAVSVGGLGMALEARYRLRRG